MDCPKCGHRDVADPSCPRCGIVFAKLQAPRTPAPPAPSSRPTVAGPAVAARSMPRYEPRTVPARSPTFGLLGVLGVLVVAAAVGGAGFRLFRGSPSVPPMPATPVSAPAAPDTGADEAPSAAELSPDIQPSVAPEAAPSLPADGIRETDLQLATGLASRLNQGGPVGPGEVQGAESLLGRYPQESKVRDLLEAVLVTAARQEQGRRRFAEAIVLLRRAATVQPSSARPPLGLLAVSLESGDWAGAEAAAREALTLDARSAEALEGLGLALFRQDRDREAVEVLESALQLREKPETRALLARIRHGMADEKGMKGQHLAHFNVRYDGDAHDEVGHEILGVLERHYATLVTVLDHQPAAAIPVILFSRAAYYDASGAPAWSGGAYDNIDGRIRIPIGGLTSSLNPHLENVLIHEVTHAFIADRTRGHAPRDIHEGLAQYMEGKRISSELSSEELAFLADGRIGGVSGFYLSALAFVEHLMGLRGQGGMNDLLRIMGETGSVDEAFRQVHGQDHQATLKAWGVRFRQQYGH